MSKGDGEELLVKMAEMFAACLSENSEWIHEYESETGKSAYIDDQKEDSLTEHEN